MPCVSSKDKTEKKSKLTKQKEKRRKGLEGWVLRQIISEGLFIVILMWQFRPVEFITVWEMGTDNILLVYKGKVLTEKHHLLHWWLGQSSAGPVNKWKCLDFWLGLSGRNKSGQKHREMVCLVVFAKLQL